MQEVPARAAKDTNGVNGSWVHVFHHGDAAVAAQLAASEVEAA